MDYTALAAKYGGKSAEPDYAALAAKFGGKAEAADPRPPLMRTMQNLAAGAVRGAGSIGATLLAPIDIAADALAGKGLSLESNRQRRADMTAGLENMGVDTGSTAFGVGKLGGEIAGTLGAGGAIANVAGRALPAAAAPAIEAIRTAGMSSGGVQGAAGAGLRALGGAVTGAASAGLVDPEQAGTGAIIGAAAPGVIQLAGKAGQAVGNSIRGGAQTPEAAAAINAARAQGYVIPPTQAKPSLANRILEGFSGKITTAQNASARNQTVTNRIAAEALGLPTDTPITADALVTLRRGAGQAYDAIGQAGAITPGAGYGKALDKIAAPYLTAAQGFPGAKVSPVVDLVESLRSPAFDASSAVAKIKELRSAADDAFRTGNTDIGRASKAAATALEDAIETHLKSTGAQQMLQDFREARQLIAKTYSVEKALNPSSGSVDARKLASQLNRGKPLSGELKDVADFANRFPKAAQPVEGMGSLPQTSPLDWIPAGALSMGTGNPLMMAGVLARPGARALTLSDLVQNRLVQGQSAPIGGLLANPEAQQFLLRAAPVAGASR